MDFGDRHLFSVELQLTLLTNTEGELEEWLLRE